MSTRAADAPGRLTATARRALPAAVVAATAVTVLVGLRLKLRAHPALGTPLPPFLMSWSPHVRWPALIGLAVAVGAAALASRAIERVRSPAIFAALAYAGTLAVGLSVNAARRGPSGWSHVFDLSGHGSFEASREYLPALKWLNAGVAHYVGRYPSILDYLPTHTKGNPPGPLVAMHVLSITTAGRLSAVCIGVGALTAPLTYALGRELGDERRGRVAAVLAIFSPSVILFGVTSLDYVFAALAVAVACLMVSRRPAVALGGCLAAGVAAFFSWVLLAIPLWVVLVVLRRDGLRAALIRALGALMGVVLVTLALTAAWGYDPIEILRTATRIYGGGAAAHRPYAFWLFGSPAAWLAMLGVPLVWAAARSLARGDAAALALAGVLLVSTVSGFTKAESERIWLPFVPLACVAAAAVPIRRLALMLAAMALQAVLIEVLFGTVW